MFYFTYFYIFYCIFIYFLPFTQPDNIFIGFYKYDRIAPPLLGQSIANRIKGSRYVEIAEAAHGVTIQYADKINSLLIENIKVVNG